MQHLHFACTSARDNDTGGIVWTSVKGIHVLRIRTANTCESCIPNVSLAPRLLQIFASAPPITPVPNPTAIVFECAATARRVHMPKWIFSPRTWSSLIQPDPKACGSSCWKIPKCHTLQNHAVYIYIIYDIYIYIYIIYIIYIYHIYIIYIYHIYMFKCMFVCVYIIDNLMISTFGPLRIFLKSLVPSPPPKHWGRTRVTTTCGSWQDPSMVQTVQTQGRLPDLFSFMSRMSRI